MKLSLIVSERTLVISLKHILYLSFHTRTTHIAKFIAPSINLTYSLTNDGVMGQRTDIHQSS